DRNVTGVQTCALPISTDYTAAVRVGEVVRHRLEQALAVVDVLATPVVPVVTAEDARASKSRPHTGGTAIFTAPFNLTGHPAISRSEERRVGKECKEGR